MKILRIIELRFILTPLATTKFIVNGIERFRVYVFGFKVADFVR